MSRGTINEQYLDDIAVAINAKLGSSSTMTPSEMASKISSIPTSSGAILGHGSFSANGSYRALDDNLDGYSTVDVSIPMTILSASSNGTYTPSVGGYNQVNVNVPLSSITISVNGSYSAAQGGYNDITVDVPQPTMSTLSINVNGSYTAPSGYAYNEVNVSVPVPSLVSLNASANGSYSAPSGYAYDEVNIDVPSAALSSKTITVNGTYDAIDDSLDGYSSVVVSVSGGGLLGSKTITQNGIYHASSDNLDGYDTVTVNISKDYGSYDWYDDGVDVAVTVDDINLSSSTDTTNFYETYHDQHINTLTINAVGDSSLIRNFNLNPYKHICCKKIIYGDGVTPIVMNTSASLYRGIKDIEIQSSSITLDASYYVSASNLVNISFMSNCNLTVGQTTFRYCQAEKITLPTNLTIMPSNIFKSCSNLRIINTEDMPCLSTIKSYAFNECKSLEKISIPVTNTIEAGAFSGCTNLEQVELSPSLSVIPASGFRECYNLVSINLSNVTSIGNQGFYQCYHLKDIELNNIITLGQQSFSNAGISRIILPNTLTTIQSSAFENCLNLKSIYFQSLTPPTVLNVNAFANLPTDCIIYVPSGYLSAYTGANNYPSDSIYTYQEWNLNN